MIRFEPALCSVTFRNLQPAAIVELAASARLAGIEWAGDVHVPPGRSARAREVRALTEDAGLSVISYGSYIAPPTDDIASFSIALETALELGAPNIRLWAGTRNRASTTYSPLERSSVAGQIREMADLARKAGVKVSLECHPDSLTDDTTSAERLVAEMGDPDIYLYWQPRPGLPLGAALDEIERLGESVSHVHVFAWDEAKRRYALAEQADQWRAAFAAIPEGRWAGRRFAMLEFVRDDDPRQFKADAATLNRMLEEIYGHARMRA